jgi:two-component system, OmpR family, sensor histidine kinase TctE
VKRCLQSLEGLLVLRLSAVFLTAIVLMGLAVAYQAYWKAVEVGDEALAHEFLQEFLSEIMWLVPLVALLAVSVTIWTVRRGLSSVNHISDAAKRITPASTSARLPTERAPIEILPLVSAVNAALDRLEQGYAAQREFTARAAHELRTPLAILTAGLENLGRGGEIEALLGDAKRMNRLVEQLLQVARLDALPLNVNTTIDLNRVAAEAVAYLAPWAVVQGRSLALEATDKPVLVRGNADALADVLRNLIENAVAHSPPRTEITVAVNIDRTLSVSDHGPGIPLADRTRVFERFWRGRNSPKSGHGAGLGLSIVGEIVKAHGASINIENGVGGGARFVIRFPEGEALPN